MKVIIVGGVAGGATAAARLRRLDEEAEIILLEKGEYISYANCGLPYHIGGEITEEAQLALQTPDSFHRRFRIDVRVCHEAISIDTDNKRIKVRGADGREYEECYNKLLLSPGAGPVRPPLKGVDDPRVFTLRTIPDTLAIKRYIRERHPERAVVVGGGAIGLEMAENLARLGIGVDIVEMAGHVLANLDWEMACEVHHYLRKKGVGLHLGVGVESFEDSGDNVCVRLADGSSLSAGIVILGVGVRPETTLAREAGIACNARGAITVDRQMRTSQPDIYAVGDAVEVRSPLTGAGVQVPLAGPANKQGRIAAAAICGREDAYRGTIGSSVLKLFGMTVATTGISEGTAKDAGLDCDKVYAYPASHATYYPGATTMAVKLLFSPGSGKVLGAQLVGFDGVDKRCDVLATAICAGMTVHGLAELELCYAPPYSSAKDPVNMVGFMAENVLDGLVRQYHWHDVDSLPKDGSVTLLDVRTVGEYNRGHIEGAVHIPVDGLREGLEQLDQSKAVYVNCQSGLRSYLACRILAQKGFDCYNLAGGYRLYSTTTREQQAVKKQ